MADTGEAVARPHGRCLDGRSGPGSTRSLESWAFGSRHIPSGRYRRSRGPPARPWRPPAADALDDARIFVVTSDGVRSTSAPVMSTAKSRGCPPGMFERPLSLRRDGPLIARHCAPRGRSAGIPSSKVGRRVDGRREFGSEPRSTGRPPCATPRKRGPLPRGDGPGLGAGFCANALVNVRSRRKALVEPRSIIIESFVWARAGFRANLQGADRAQGQDFRRALRAGA